MKPRQFYFCTGVVCLVAAMADTSWHRYAWVFFGLSFICAFDFIKDVEKAKRKERDMTEIRMKQDWLEGWEKSQDEKYALVTQQIAATSDTLLRQLATYVRVGTPDRTCEHCEKESK
jgi:hypothetical protein